MAQCLYPRNSSIGHHSQFILWNLRRHMFVAPFTQLIRSITDSVWIFLRRTGLSHKLWAFLQVENSMTIICASTPPLNSFVKRIRGIPDHLPQFRRSSQGTIDLTGKRQLGSSRYIHMRSPNQTQHSESRDVPIEMVAIPSRRSRLSQISDLGKKVMRLTRSRLSQPLPPLPKEAQRGSEDVESADDVERRRR